MSEKLNIQNLIDLLAAKHGIKKKDSENFIREFFNLIEDSLEKDKYVKIKGLGVFRLIEVENRESVNVNTGERFEIQGYNKISFTPDAALKEQINKPFSHFETVVLNEGIVFDNEPEQQEEDGDAIENDASTTGSSYEEVSLSSVESIPLPEENRIASDALIVEKEVASATQPEENQTSEAKHVASPEVPSTHIEPTTLNEHSESIPSIGASEKISSSSSSQKFFIAIVVLTLLICIGGISYFYYPEKFDLNQVFHFTNDSELKEPASSQIETQLIEPDTSFVRKEENTELIEDDEALEKTEAVETSEEIKVDLSQEPSKETHVAEVGHEKKAPVPFKPDSVNYRIVGLKTNYVLQDGETLVKLALRFYGNKALWLYIAKYNSDVIKDPDNVPAGINLKIPELVERK